MVDVFEETYYTNHCLDDDEKHFHSIIGHIEDIIMNQEFLDMHAAFLEKHWTEFEDSEENKFAYTDIFNEYTSTIEKYLEDELNDRVPNFNMTQFESDLKDRQTEFDGEVFEVLSTFSDFCAFKTMFLDYKNMKEGKTADFSFDLCVSKYITSAEDDDSDEVEAAAK